MFFYFVKKSLVHIQMTPHTLLQPNQRLPHSKPLADALNSGDLLKVAVNTGYLHPAHFDFNLSTLNDDELDFLNLGLSCLDSTHSLLYQENSVGTF